MRHRDRQGIETAGGLRGSADATNHGIASASSLLMALLVLASPLARAEEAEHFSRFGELALYREAPHPSHVVLFVSGDGGWSQGVIEMAEARALPDAVPGVADLPVVEVPATAGRSDALAFIASGDGGWASLDKDVAGVLAARGIPAVGLNTLQYYWQPRSPEESARALERILRHYLAKWQRERVLLIGYSRGADVLPFMASRLPADLADRVDLIAFLGPGPAITFEFHFTDWVSDLPRGRTEPVQPEIEKLRGKKLLCVYGAEEADSICPRLPDGLAHLYERPGGHHFGGDYQVIAERILAESGH